MDIYRSYRLKRNKAAGLFFLILLVSFGLHNIKFLNIPFLWLSSVFKLIGLIISSMFNNNHIEVAEITWNGNIIFNNNSTSFTSQIFSQYLFCSLLGGVVCINAKRFRTNQNAFILSSFIVGMLLIIMPYSRSLSSWVIYIFSFSLILGLIIIKYRNEFVKYLTLLFGCFCIIHSVYKPFIDYKIAPYCELEYLFHANGVFAYIIIGIMVFVNLFILNYVWFRVVNVNSYLDMLN